MPVCADARRGRSRCFDPAESGSESRSLRTDWLTSAIAVATIGLSGATVAHARQGAPPNDSCSEAIAIPIGSTSFSTVNATTDGPSLPESCDKGFGTAFVQDVWFLHTATFSGTLEVSTCSAADFDTRLAGYLFEGACGQLQLAACNDDGAGCAGFTSIMQLPVDAGKTYLIRVGGYAGEGTGTLTLTDELSDICVPSDHGCFEVGLPGCDDFDCCTAVCVTDPFCCVAAWDFVCVAQATIVCNDCGEPDAGDCCVPSGTPSCNVGDCCAAVCAVDQFCCQVAWDELCVAEAELLVACGCGDEPPPLCGITGHSCFVKGHPGCKDIACCSAICGIDPFCCDVGWDAMCVDAAIALCPACGNPSLGNCCFATGSTHCADPACCNAVCASDPFCCEVVWDELCGEQAQSNAACSCDFGDACPGDGACNEPNGSVGCSDAACCAAVCAVDLFCCGVEWDQLCADAASTVCAGECVGDVNGDAVVDGLDLGILLNAWNTTGSAADLNNDGTVNGADLGLLLNDWGACG